MGNIVGLISVCVILYLFAYIGNRAKERKRKEELEVKTFIDTQEELYRKSENKDSE